MGRKIIVEVKKRKTVEKNLEGIEGDTIDVTAQSLPTSRE